MSQSQTQTAGQSLVPTGGCRYSVSHVTEYQYSLPVPHSRQLLRLSPRNLAWQQCHASRIQVDPQPEEWFELDDFYGNHLVQFALRTPHTRLSVRVDSQVLVLPHAAQWVAENSLSWERVRQQLANGGTEVLDPIQYLFPSTFIPIDNALSHYALPSFTPERPLLSALLDFTGRIFNDFTFDPTATTIATPVETLLQEKKGVCQDFAHLQIACLRSLGLAARYVSGYILTQPPPGEERMIGADASHAWVSVYCPPYGWVDIDPTNNVLADTQHITVAWGRDFGDVSPMHGIIFGGGAHRLDVKVTVMPQ
ncbi:transglutaminase family protein [Serratia inhibens]|uniref:Transglutaminase family protein n=1 Tax=Serratia inhibens TaxID=2338073 RepID=A0AA92X2J9_9GAMM|nr:transglutaminase family protein [Serratia inhibens]RJF54526.1 transglutaminase family protein [Serratia inhibens]